MQFSNAFLPISVKLLDSFTFLRLLHPPNAYLSIFVTESGITILSRLLQPAKASVPIYVTVFGILIVVIQLSANNAPGIEVIPSSIVMFFRAVHPVNGPEPLDTTLSILFGISILSNDVQSLNASLPISVKLLDSFTLLRLPHPTNAYLSIFVTESGITILSRLLQFAKAELSILVIVPGISMLSSPGQLAKRPVGIVVAPFSNVTVLRPLQS